MSRAGDQPVDVLDEHDRVVATLPRRVVRAQNLRHRSTAVAVVSSTGALLVHRRAEDKDVWPGRWDLAAGGLLGVGEEWSAGARRELAEELGIDAPLTELGAASYRDDEVDALVHVFLVCHDGPFRFADGEVLEARFVHRAELDRLLAEAPFVPDSRAVVLPLVRHLVTDGPPAGVAPGA